MDQSILLKYAIGIILVLFPGFIFYRAMSHMLKKEKEHTKSPFSEKLLRPPGESLRLKIDALHNDIDNLAPSIVVPIVAPGILCILLSNLPLSTVLVITFLVSLICWGIVFKHWKKIRKLRKDLINYRLGFDGERYVATELAPLAARGYHIFHDFIYDMNGREETYFNIDHIAIGPEGVFTIETKAKRKSKNTPKNNLKDYQLSVEADAEGNAILRFPDNTTSKKPITQALQQAKLLQAWIQKSGIELKVRPIVVYPGWYVITKYSSLCRILSAKSIAKVLPNLCLGKKLSTAEINSITARI